MTARGFQPEHVGAPSAQDLEEAGLVRCEECHEPTDETKIENGRCTSCRSSRAPRCAIPGCNEPVPYIGDGEHCHLHQNRRRQAAVPP